MLECTAPYRRFILAALLALGPLTACNFKEVKDENDSNSGGETPVDPGAPVSFAEIQSKILEPSCTICHSASGGNDGGVNLETYAAVKAKIDKIKTTTVDKKTMPLGDTLPANLIALLKAWIDQGAPQ